MRKLGLMLFPVTYTRQKNRDAEKDKKENKKSLGRVGTAHPKLAIYLQNQDSLHAKRN